MGSVLLALFVAGTYSVKEKSYLQEKLFAAFQQVEAGSDGVIQALDDMVTEKHGAQ